MRHLAGPGRTLCGAATKTRNVLVVTDTDCPDCRSRVEATMRKMAEGLDPIEPPTRDPGPAAAQANASSDPLAAGCPQPRLIRPRPGGLTIELVPGGG